MPPTTCSSSRDDREGDENFGRDRFVTTTTTCSSVGIKKVKKSKNRIDDQTCDFLQNRLQHNVSGDDNNNNQRVTSTFLGPPVNNLAPEPLAQPFTEVILGEMMDYLDEMNNASTDSSTTNPATSPATNPATNSPYRSPNKSYATQLLEIGNLPIDNCCEPLVMLDEGEEVLNPEIVSMTNTLISVDEPGILPFASAIVETCIGNGEEAPPRSVQDMFDNNLSTIIVDPRVSHQEIDLILNVLTRRRINPIKIEGKEEKDELKALPNTK